MKARSRSLVLSCGAMLLASPPLVAQGTSPDETAAAVVREVFGSERFRGESFGPARWLAGGGAYTTVEPSATRPGGSEIVRYDAATGRRTVVIAAELLVPEGAREPLDVADYAWSADGARLLLFTNTRKVWRDHTRGDYWVLDGETGELRQLGGPDAPEASLMFAEFSPSGDRVAYVREGDLWVEDVVTGALTRLTTSGSQDVVNGTTDWVYEEEFSLRDAFRWSPDGSRIAYWRFDMSGVGDFLMINNTDSVYSFTVPVQYPKAGTTNSAVTAGVIPATGGETVWLDLPGDPRDDYLPRMEWAGPDALVLQRMNRLQNTNRVLLADASTGQVRELLVERDAAWLDVVDSWQWLHDGRELLWVSERDGWRHLYTVPRAGGEPRLLTPGDYDVVSVEAVDEAEGWIYFIAAPDDPTRRYLFRVPLTGGEAERITPADVAGTHRYDIAPGAEWALHSWSTFDSPPVTELVALPGHTVQRTLVANEPLMRAAAEVVHRPTEFFRVPVSDGVELDGWMILPRDFDPSLQYPLLMYVYSEPASQTARDQWGGRRALWHRGLADLGYVVANVDNRGTPSPRGRDWRKVVYGSVGALASREQAAAVRALASSRPYIDPSRVASWGWSGGGSATLNALFRYPDTYRVGMSVAPVADQRLYDTVYQERYMGLPQDNRDGYRLGSPIHHADGLRGDLLIVHGTGDDNVHWQGTERLVDRLIGLGKTFDYMAYPNRSHCICEGPGTTEHVYTLLTRYLLEHLPPGGR